MENILINNEWNEISREYMEYQSKVISGEIPVDSSLQLWVFDWLKKNYYPPMKKGNELKINR